MDKGKAWNIPMILHDWQAAATASQLCKIYGFSSPRACRDRISKWRKKGWPFELKKAGCPRRKRKGQITQMWMDELTDSEATTAGIISGCNHEHD
jgi:hypothetical protein